MQTKLTERFIECMNLIKETNNIPSTRQFSRLIDIHPQCISDLINGKREANADLIARLVKIFGINANYIFTGNGNPYISYAAGQATPDIETPIIAVVTDNKGSERIAHVPYAAQAGYTDSLHDPVFMSRLETFTLPDRRFSTGTHRSFEVSGDSMEPTINDGEHLICSFVDKDLWRNNIKSNYVYVIITDSGIVVKRIINNIDSDGALLIKSDNSFYEVISIPIAKVKEVWLVTHKLSAFKPASANNRNALHKEVDNLRLTIADQGKMILSLNSTIEKMLKQNRQMSARY